MNAQAMGNSPSIASADWAYECAQSKAHAYIKLIVHTLRILIRSNEPDTEVSDDDLSRLTSLSPKTVQRYRLLAEREGWIEYRAGRGRSKVSTYRVAVPKETLNQLASRLDALTKKQSVRPPLETENRSVSPSGGPTTRENRSVSPTQGETGKKEIPPKPPKEKIYNKPTTTELVGNSGVVGLNGSAAMIVERLAGWINPMMPDKRTAQGALESLIKLYTAPIVRDSFAELEAKILHGDIIAKPIPYLTSACQRRATAPPKNQSPSGYKPRQKTPNEMTAEELQAHYDRGGV